MSDNIIKLGNNAVIPEIVNREGKITLYYGNGKNTFDESIEIEGSITVSEACFLHKLLGAYIDKKNG
jgi:predicted acyltransferase (DUF342 family)